MQNERVSNERLASLSRIRNALNRAEAFAAEYEFDSDEGCHTPNDLERMLMLDMLNGLFDDEAFITTLIDQQRRPSVVTPEMVEAALKAYFPGEEWNLHKAMGDVNDIVASHMRAALTAALSVSHETGDGETEGHQQRVAAWMQECFGPEITADKVERVDRFIEESLELAQATGWTADRARALVDYVFGRPVGEIGQEVGGVMVTLAALCNVFEIDMNAEAKREVDRITQPDIVLKIRAKQASKPTGSALPAPPITTEGE